MNPLSSFAILIATAQSLAAAVNTRDQLHLRPPVACKAVAMRLASGLVVLRAFLRRLVILIALELEWGLVDKRGEMKRPHMRKAKSRAVLSLGGLEANKANPWLDGGGPQFKARVKTGNIGPVEVNMANLYTKLDFLAAIAANPLAKAKRLAFYLARRYPYDPNGIIIAPEGPKRIAGRWGTQVRASYDAIAGSIMIQSRNRPPPLPPPRTCWPTVTAL
jgi:hypothetical protein